MTADVAPLAGVMISQDAAIELVAALDQLDRLAAPKSMRLSARLAAIRRELQTCVSRVDTRADTSPNHVAAQAIAQFECSVVDTTTAAEVLGITRDGVTWLCRNGSLQASRNGGRWFVTLASLHDYRAARAAR